MSLSGIGPGVFDMLNGGGAKVEKGSLPPKVQSVLEGIKDARSKIVVGKALFAWHCRKRMHTLEYSPGGIGTSGFYVVNMKVCEVCGKVLEKKWADTSGVPF